MKYVPAIVSVVVILTLFAIVSRKQEATTRTIAERQLNVPEFARSRIELKSSDQLVLIDAQGNIMIK